VGVGGGDGGWRFTIGRGKGGGGMIVSGQVRSFSTYTACLGLWVIGPLTHCRQSHRSAWGTILVSAYILSMIFISFLYVRLKLKSSAQLQL
jgi:hypothetical protein